MTKSAINEKEIAEILQNKIRQEVEGIIKETVKNLSSKKMGLYDIEKTIREKVLQIGGNILEASLKITGTGYRGSRIKCDCGHKKEFVEYRKKTISTLVSMVTINRAYYFCYKCGNSYIPLDKEFKIEDSRKSPGVTEAMCITSAMEPFRPAEEMLYKLAGIKADKETIRNTAEKIGNILYEQQNPEIEKYYWENRKENIPTEKLPYPKHLYTTADGTCVNTLDGWKEIKCGAIFDADIKDGEPQRAKTTYIGSFEDSTNFMKRLYVEAYKRGIDNAGKQIALGDGAKWIWNEIDFNIPDAVKILDYYHATEKIWDIGKIIYPADENKVKIFVEPYLNCLNAGKTNKMIKKIKRIETKSTEMEEKIQQAIIYYQNNKDKMNYEEYKKQGYFIGSGVVESSCKHLVSKRLKRSSMKWSQKGATGILQLRTCLLNNNWDNFWRNYNCG